MKQGGRTFSPTGFTIIETMIVLAVTGVLAASVLLLIAGRQNKTEFQTGINNLQQQLQQIINETESGYYPNTGGTGTTNFTCTAGTPPVITSGTGQQGTNSGCMFLGKVIYFGPGNAANSFSVFPVAGNRVYNGSPVTTLAQSWPVALSQGHVVNSGAPAKNYTVDQMESGLSFVGQVTGGGTPTAKPLALGVMSSVGTQTGGGFAGANSGTSGAAAFSLYGFYNGWGSVSDLLGVADKIGGATTSVNTTNTSVNTTKIQPAPGPLEFCIASGTTNQSGLFTVTTGLTVTLQIKNGTTC